MTRDEIIEMAREAGVYARGHYDETGSTPEEIERFFHAAYAAGAASEREACAEVCDGRAMLFEAAAQRAEPDEVSAIRSTAWSISVCASAIRSRREK